MDVQERIQKLKEQLVITVVKPVYSGGQTCGIQPNKVVGIHEDLGIKIEIEVHRSTLKNKELVQTIFDLIFMELIK